MAYKQKSGSPFQRNFGIGKSPMKLAGNWVTGEDGIPVQISKGEVRKHGKLIDAALENASEVGRDFVDGNINRSGPEGWEESPEGKAIIADREKAVTDLGAVSTTGKESLDAIREGMTDAEKKMYGAPGHEDFRMLNPETAVAWDKANEEAIAENKSGVAAEQEKLNKERNYDRLAQFQREQSSNE